jgi:hypothetical protein
MREKFICASYWLSYLQEFLYLMSVMCVKVCFILPYFHIWQESDSYLGYFIMLYQLQTFVVSDELGGRGHDIF